MCELILGEYRLLSDMYLGRGDLGVGSLRGFPRLQRDTPLSWSPGILYIWKSAMDSLSNARDVGAVTVRPIYGELQRPSPFSQAQF